MYTNIDLCGAYNLVCIQEGDEWNATFKTNYNHFEYVVIPFGLTNILVVFQHLRKDGFHEYLDDFLFDTSMTSSFFRRTWMTTNAMYVLFWKSFRKLDFMPNWRNVNSINLK